MLVCVGGVCCLGLGFVFGFLVVGVALLLNGS